jgi:malate dehydrogenase (oxaloacetate-decarboxylating)(NADP+)
LQPETPNDAFPYRCRSLWLGQPCRGDEWCLTKATSFTEREALFYHSTGRAGKIEIIASKPMATQRDLSLAYSPGVAVPVAGHRGQSRHRL